jgi:hypothetical protein
MVLFDGPFVRVSQGFFTGWRIEDKLTGTVAIPNRLLKERIGLTWIQVRRTKKSRSVDSGMSEDVMFGSFAKAVLDPSSDEGNLWALNSHDQLADHFIETGNSYMNSVAELFPPRKPF